MKTKDATRRRLRLDECKDGSGTGRDKQSMSLYRARSKSVLNATQSFSRVHLKHLTSESRRVSADGIIGQVHERMAGETNRS